MPENKTAAAYIRVSTDDQLEYSPDSQIKKIKEYANQKNIFISDEFIFIDEGISGRKAEKRPAFMKMISLAKIVPRPFDMILVWKFSRFARNREDSIIYKSMLRKQCGIDVVSVSELLGEDKTSILIEAMLEAMDEYYSINLSEEVKRGMNEKFSRGGIVSPPPFGYKMGNDVFVPNKETAPIVKMIFEDYISGMGIRKIAMKLNDIGIRTTRGNRFESRTIEYILRNPTYIGKLRRNISVHNNIHKFHDYTDNTIIDGQHQPIINNELFYSVNKKLSESKKQTVKFSRCNRTDFMLRGLIRCSSCNSTLIQSVKGKSLQCHKYAKGQCKTSHSITISKINEAVITKLNQDLKGCEFIFKAGTEITSTYKINSLLIEKEHRKLAKVKEAFEAGIDSLEEYRQNKLRICNRITNLKTNTSYTCDEYETKKVNISHSQLMNILRNNIISENVKNIILRSFISEIVFDKKNMTIQIKYLPIIED